MNESDMDVIGAVHEVVQGGDLVLSAGYGHSEDGEPPNPAEIRLKSNGDIYVNGRLAANDTEVVDGLRKFLEKAQIEGK